MNQPVSASTQLAQLEKSLLQAYVQKDEADAARAKAVESITAIRNLLSGVPLGQKVQGEIDAASRPPTPPA